MLPYFLSSLSVHAMESLCAVDEVLHRDLECSLANLLRNDAANFIEVCPLEAAYHLKYPQDLLLVYDLVEGIGCDLINYWMVAYSLFPLMLDIAVRCRRAREQRTWPR